MKTFKTNNGTILIVKECSSFYFAFAYSFENLSEKELNLYTGSKKQFKAIVKEIALNNGLTVESEIKERTFKTEKSCEKYILNLISKGIKFSVTGRRSIIEYINF